MEESTLMAMVGALKNKNPAHLKKDTVTEVRDLIQFSRSDIMSLTLQQATQLLTGLLEDDRIKELSRAGIHVTLAELSKPAPRKERVDKGVPRKNRAQESAGEQPVLCGTHPAEPGYHEYLDASDAPDDGDRCRGTWESHEEDEEDVA